MYIFDITEHEILLNRFFLLKKKILYFFSGIINEVDFKFFRLQNGLYRQRLSYMYRIMVPYGILSFKQIYLISYLLNKFDKNYFHLTTRTNIQLNWIKIIDINDLFYYLIFTNINSIQTSGNCIRNITIGNNYFSKNYIRSEIWAEILKQWFNLNSEFLFLPRKFKISLLSSKNDDVHTKVHDLSIWFEKNLFNNLIIYILIGGGLGRTPLRGIYIFKYLHWKNVINYCDKIVRFYNINGYKDNIYKSRIKILLKFLNWKIIKNFLKNEYIYSNNFIYFTSEKEINKINNKIIFKKKYFNYFFLKKIKYNLFFLNWINFNIFFKNNYLIIFLVLNNLNSPSGDINTFQLKILFYIFIKNFNYLFLNNKQCFILFLFKIYIYELYEILTKYFFIIYNFNSILNIISCPGKDFCSLANSESISLANSIKYLFKDYNSIKKLNFFKINISGCINSCSHYQLSNLGFLGIKKEENFYQFFIGGDNSFNNLLFSKPLGSSLSYNDILKIFIKFLKIYLKIFIKNNYFIDIYNKYGFTFFKNYIYKND